MLKSKKTILGALLCAIMALCLTLGAVGLMPKTETAFAADIETNVTPDTYTPTHTVTLAVGDKLTVNIKNKASSTNTFSIVGDGSKFTFSKTTLDIGAGETGKITITAKREATSASVVSISNKNGLNYVLKLKVNAPTYTVTFNTNAELYGSVSTESIANVAKNTTYSVDGNKLTVGETEITATANEDYEFDCWKIGDNKVTKNGTITADTTFTAVFKEKAPAVGDTFAVDGINYVITAIGDTNTVKVGDNTSFAGTSVNIPATVTHKDVTFTVTEIGKSAFKECTNLTSVTISASVTTVGESAFSGCSSLASVTFADNSSLTIIGKKAFEGTAITEIEIPASVTNIGMIAFWNCKSLTSITFEENSRLATIGENAFEATAITEIELPASVTNIDGWAFLDCANLTTVKLLSTEVPTIGSEIFIGCNNLQKIYVPADSVDAYKDVANLSDIADKIQRLPFKNVAEVLASADFPTTAADAWMSENGVAIYLADGNTLTFSQGDNTFTAGTALTVSKQDGYYKCISAGGWSVMFSMEDDKVVGIIFDAANESYNYLKGEYKCVQTVEKPTADTTNFVYSGEEQTYTIATNDAYTISDNTKQTNAGAYTITVSLKNAQYKWADGTTEDLTFNFVIAMAQVEKPTADSTNFVYDGQQKTYTVATSDYYTVSDNLTQTNVGEYTITVALNSKVNAVWADGTTDDLTFNFVINQKVDDVVIQDVSGEEITDPKVMIVSAENGIKPGAVFVVEVVNLEKAEDTEQTETLLTSNNKIAQNEKIYGIYDAKLLLDGTTVQPNGTITIKMFVPEELRGKDFKLYHIHNGTEVMEIDNYEDAGEGYITFDVDKLSQFAFVGETPNENTCLSAGAIVGIVLGSIVFIVLVVYALGYFFLYRKGKLDDKKIKVIYKFLPKSNDNK